jgi:hypothetical protein
MAAGCKECPFVSLQKLNPRSDIARATVDFDAGEGAMATMHIVAGATMPAKSA